MSRFNNMDNDYRWIMVIMIAVILASLLDCQKEPKPIKTYCVRCESEQMPPITWCEVTMDEIQEIMQWNCEHYPADYRCEIIDSTYEQITKP